MCTPSRPSAIRCFALPTAASSSAASRALASTLSRWRQPARSLPVAALTWAWLCCDQRGLAGAQRLPHDVESQTVAFGVPVIIVVEIVVAFRVSSESRQQVEAMQTVLLTKIQELPLRKIV